MADKFKVVPRPKLALWMFERGLKLRDAAISLEISLEQVRRICLPFGHPDRRVPDEYLMAIIVQWTNGAVAPADFYPASISDEAVRLVRAL